MNTTGDQRRRAGHTIRPDSFPATIDDASMGNGNFAHFTPSIINDVLDEFETGWSPAAEYLPKVAERSGFVQSADALAELIRADIDRRYSLELPVELANYLARFPQLNESPQATTEIAFEDYRARLSRGLSLTRTRWAPFPGVETCDWFRELPPNSSNQDSLAPADHALSIPHLTASALTASPQVEPVIGEQFGDFQLLGLLGTGTFSKVFLATQTSLASRYVALKVVRRTLAEPEHLARMQHTGIIPLFSLHRIGHYSALCMPYAGATTLADWLQRTRQPVDTPRRDGQGLVDTVQASQQRLTINISRSASSFQSDEPLAVQLSGDEKNKSLGATGGINDSLQKWNRSCDEPLQQLGVLDTSAFTLWFARQVAAALSHAHLRGIVHGDLKPANILIRNDGEPALIDFNLAHMGVDNDAAIIGGTLPYMSPEQFRALLTNQSLIDLRSDVYSFGVILYELCEGKLPFHPPHSSAGTDLASALAVRQSVRPEPKNKFVTPGLRAIITKCLSFDENDRYQNATELLEEIERERLNVPLQHTAEPLSGRWKKLTRRFPRVFSAAAIGLIASLLLAIVATVGYSWWYRSQTLDAQATLSTVKETLDSQLEQLIDADANAAFQLANAHTAALNHQLGAPVTFNQSPILNWLNATEQAELKSLIFESHLTAAFLLSEKTPHASAMTDVSIVQQHLDICKQFPELAAESPMFRCLASHSKPESKTTFTDAPPANTNPAETILEARLRLLVEDAQGSLRLLESDTNLQRRDLLFWLTIGEAQLKLRNFPAAELSFTLAINEAPTLAISYRRRAQTRMASNQIEKAIADFSAAIQRSPQDYTLWAERALARERLPDVATAIADVSKALILRPAANRLLFIRSRLHRTLGQQTRGDEDYRKALSNPPSTIEDWVSRGLARARQSPSDGLSDLHAALALNPSSPLVLQNIAHVESELMGDNSAAVETLDRLLDLQPYYEMARGGRAVLLARLQRPEESIADIEFLLKTVEKPLPATLYQIACAHAMLSETREPSRDAATRFLAKALRLGYGQNLLDTDPDLAPIRRDPAFLKLRDLIQLSTD